jgi:hypothetical protein
MGCAIEQVDLIEFNVKKPNRPTFSINYMYDCELHCFIHYSYLCISIV